MTFKPVVYETTHRIAFSELDPFQHVSTGNYARYFTDHRMEGLAKYAGWDLPTIGTLGFMTWIRRMEIDFIKSVGPTRRSRSPRSFASSAAPTR